MIAAQPQAGASGTQRQGLVDCDVHEDPSVETYPVTVEDEWAILHV